VTGAVLPAPPPRLVATPRGPARLDVTPAVDPVALLVLGHGAGGSVDAPDLAAVTAAAAARGVSVVRVTQPYRVAGRRSPAPAAHLDETWLAVLAALTGEPGLAGLPVVVGGRSSGARVACRTARAGGASGVVALAFPLHPPTRPGRSRAAELATGVATLVVTGERDPFGVPPARTGLRVEVVPGADHSLRQDTARVAGAVLAWLSRRRWARPSRR